MCGRYTLTTPDLEALARVVQAEISPELREAYRPRYNIAPTQATTIVYAAPEEGRRLDLGLWGVHLAGNRPGAQINVRAESAATAPGSRELFARGRCGVLADGFYEWSGPKEHRQPHWFHTPGGRLIVFAGLYQDVRDEATGEVTRRFAILTTGANLTVGRHHDRMPAIVPRGQLGRWLAPLPRTANMAEKTALAHLLGPAPDDMLVDSPVSTRVNSPRFDDPSCLEPEPTLLEDESEAPRGRSK
ncbi:SOS response-associated peptidase [Nannocystis bainbridge]|uniref:Abasic site processing protein n=1 Tax=Nannocystis bainbridge TaxID=2995303 RepID=A0ABT5E216_9BACT|nr:SOS response-associated peptidase [Nannocystis bainbridge]MDC0718756.1 SOS response-associated peptidase [Nannocystis bainbridge]